MHIKFQSIYFIWRDGKKNLSHLTIWMLLTFFGLIFLYFRVYQYKCLNNISKLVIISNVINLPGWNTMFKHWNSSTYWIKIPQFTWIFQIFINRKRVHICISICQRSQTIQRLWSCKKTFSWHYKNQIILGVAKLRNF